MEKEKLHALVSAAQDGNSEAISQLMEDGYQDIYYYILKIVKEKELAEDLTQDTFLRILEKLPELKSPEAYVTWSRQLAHNGCADYLRKRKELLVDEYEDGSTVFDTLPEEDVEFIPHEALDREDLKKTLLEMLDALPMEQRSAMVLRYYEELSVNQIAQIQKVSVGTVKSRLNYGRKAMVKSVEEYEKKNNIKLHSVTVLPLLLWLFRKQKLSKGVSITMTSVAGTSSSTSTGTSAFDSKTVAAGIKTFFGTLAGKVTMLAAVLLVVIMSIVLITGNSGSDTPFVPDYELPDYTEVENWQNNVNMILTQEECHAVFYGRVAYTDSRFYDSYDDPNKRVCLIDDALVRAEDTMRIRAELDYTRLVQEWGPDYLDDYEIYEKDGVSYCTITPQMGEPFTCEASDLQQAVIKVYETYGPALVCDVDPEAYVEYGTEVTATSYYRNEDDEVRLACLLHVGFEDMTFTTTTDKCAKEYDPAPAAPTDNRVDVRKYLSTYEELTVAGVKSGLTTPLSFKINLNDLVDDYQDWVVDAIPEDHPYYDSKLWAATVTTKGVISWINKDYDVIELKLHVPEGRDWTCEYEVVHGTFQEGDVLHFYWDVNEEGLALIEELFHVDFVFEEFTFTMKDLIVPVVDDPLSRAHLILEGSNGSGYARVSFDYPIGSATQWPVISDKNGSLSNGDVVYFDLDHIRDDVLAQGFIINEGMLELTITGLPE